MNDRPCSLRADRPWQLVALAGASWLPPWAVAGRDVNGEIVAIWLLLLALTVLPLSYRDPRAFRRTCQTVGGILLGLEIVVSIPFLLLVLPFLVAFLPAGAVLLLAGWKRGGPVRTGLAAVLTAFPFVVAVGVLCHSH
ncbi:hypothetical protein [Streptomyces sp. CBMA123]|uniref:hypothetical protein n=1 Tax=Streptomyces sp. CBMA123 TaxID=1896313 RepID=UPI001661F85D|nr:hypothetical protein [Streptomyces sp. CBMA123]MBD0689596.1 hypothetical protein [Streptomyces sp. CBMA123]